MTLSAAQAAYLVILLGVPVLAFVVALVLMRVARAKGNTGLAMDIWTWTLGLKLFLIYIFVYTLANIVLRYLAPDSRWVILIAADLLLAVVLLTRTGNVVAYVTKPNRLLRIEPAPEPNCRAATAMVRSLAAYLVVLATLILVVNAT